MKQYAIQVISRNEIETPFTSIIKYEKTTEIYSDAALFAAALADLLNEQKTKRFVIKAGEWDGNAKDFAHFVYREKHGDIKLGEDCTSPNFMMF